MHLASKRKLDNITDIGSNVVWRVVEATSADLDLDGLGGSEGAGRGEEEGLLDSSEEHLGCLVESLWKVGFGLRR